MLQFQIWVGIEVIVSKNAYAKLFIYRAHAFNLNLISSSGMNYEL